jgi:hypothetical protein
VGQLQLSGKDRCTTGSCWPCSHARTCMHCCSASPKHVRLFGFTTHDPPVHVATLPPLLVLKPDRQVQLHAWPSTSVPPAVVRLQTIESCSPGVVGSPRSRLPGLHLQSNAWSLSWATSVALLQSNNVYTAGRGLTAGSGMDDAHAAVFNTRLVAHKTDVTQNVYSWRPAQ